MPKHPSAVPLPPPRAEDLPWEDGEPLETPKHDIQIHLLIESLALAWKGRRDYFVGGNMFFYFSEAQSKKNDFRGPDFFVALDVEWKERLSWVVWEEDGKRPDVIIELTSPSTTDVDHGVKKSTYARLAIPEYFIFEPYEGTLEGFRLDLSRGRYVSIEPDARGWMRSECLGFWLGVVQEGEKRDHEGPWLRWFDDQGVMLPEPEEAYVSAEAQRQVAEAQRQAAEAEARAAEARAAELAAKLAAYEARFGKIGE